MPNSGSVFFWLFNIYAYGSAVLAFLLLLEYRSRTGSLRERKQIGIILVATVLYYVANGLISFLLRLFVLSDQNAVFEIAPGVSLILMVGYLSAIRKFRLMRLEPIEVAGNVLGSLIHPGFILHSDGSIAFCNAGTCTLLGINHHEAHAKHLGAFLREPEKLKASLVDMLTGRTHRVTLSLCFTSSDPPGCSVNCSVSKIVDNLQETIGFLITVLDRQLDASAIEALRDSHGISDREQQIIALLMQGLSNKEITSILNLRDRTMRNQIQTIFTKLGVEDKSGLADLLDVLKHSHCQEGQRN